mgnify:CR=1 FL=1
MSTKNQNLSAYNPADLPSAKGLKIGIVVAEWNEKVTGSLARGAKDLLEQQGIDQDDLIEIMVPGSFELPSGAQAILEKHSPDAVIILGCVIQGETRHFDFICQGVTKGVMDLSIQYKTPVIFGLLTTETMEQALARSGGDHGNKGIEAAVTALKMTSVWK